MRRAAHLTVTTTALAMALSLSACGGSSGTPAAAAVTGADAVNRCAAGDLTASLGPVSTLEGDQRERQIVLTNRSSRRCAVSGYPGVQLVADAGSSWDLERSPLVNPSRIVLAPGSAAHAALRYLPAEPGVPGAFEATRILVTPPDTTTTTTLTWDDGPLLDQSGATHPGTYVLALTAG
ncbi:DUF4232 domain-containing protein [Frankia sp. R82]|uniref:DUF4232 domain-containing protein n=1 Tax=Frankia sp. R82 TaxID=2950553 RepID=UPI002043A478|nr:DUF4232 domain-containing protein [Frankia sp. R82]MCM3884064.1 DUF4232 domain-containing protein [Frankia sp. R82]